VLAAVSAAMRDLLRDRDLCGRFGGEEFALLLPRTAAAQALEITERIRHGVSQLAIPRDGTAAIRVTISVGIAVPDRARRTLDDLIAAADPRPLPGQAQRPTASSSTPTPGSAGQPTAAATAHQRPAGLSGQVFASFAVSAGRHSR
jgi:hypothetical protein